MSEMSTKYVYTINNYQLIGIGVLVTKICHGNVSK